MSPIDIPPKPELWLPPRSAIVRPAKDTLDEASLGVLLCAARRRAAMAGDPLSRTYGSAGTAGNTASPNYGTLTAPNPAAERRILAVICLSNNFRANGVATCTIAGISATMLHEYDNRPGGSDGATVSFWDAAVPAGASVTVTATLDTTVGNNRGSACFVYGIFGLTAVPVISDFADDNDNNADDKVDLDIDCPAGGLIFGAMAGQGRGNQLWTEITEDAEANVGFSGDTGVASGEFATTQTGLAIDGSNSSASFIVGSAISIGPS